MADSGFPIGVDWTSKGGVDPPEYVLYVKTKESGPLQGGGTPGLACESTNAIKFLSACENV